MINCKPHKKHMHPKKEGWTNYKIQGLWFEITVKPGAKQHSSILITTMICMSMSWTKDDKNKNFTFINKVRGFQNYGVVRDLDAMLQG